MGIASRPPRPARPASAERCHGHAPPSRLRWFGVACLAGVACTIALAATLSLPAAGALVLALLLLAVLGKEAAIPAGLLLGSDPFLVAAGLLLLDAGILLLAAPRLAGTRPPLLVAAIARRRNGMRRPTTLRSLYLHALMPFVYLGPLVAALRGEATGLPPRRLLWVVLAATATSIAGWTLVCALGLAAFGAPPMAVVAAVAVPLCLFVAGLSVARSRGTAGHSLRA